MQLRGSRRVRCDTKKPLEYQLGFISQGGPSASVFNGLYAPFDLLNGKIRYRKTTLNGAVGSAGSIVECYWTGSVWFFTNTFGSVSVGTTAPTVVDFPWQVGGFGGGNIVTRKDRLFY
jgi:hypothetical protein